MFRKYFSKIIRSVTSVLLSAVIMAGCFGFSASAESSMTCKVTYSTKYTYLSVTPSKSGNRIFYSVDGSRPDEDSKLYKSRLRASSAVTVRLVEYNKNGGEVDRKKLTLKRKCSKPEILTEDTDKGVKVTLSCDTSGATIYYTTNGKKPSTSSKAYSKPFIVESGAIVRAVAVKSGWLYSAYLKNECKLTAAGKVETTGEDSDKEVSDVMSEAKKVTDSEVLLKVFEETNEYRVKNGLYELKLDPELCRAAEIRVNELLSSDYSCQHYRLDGRKWHTVLDEIDYRYSFAAENLAYTTGRLSTANTVVQLWIDSKSHRLNMLNTLGDDIGLAYVKNGNKVYWVQLFGKDK